MNIYSCDDCGEHFNSKEIKVVMLENEFNEQDHSLYETNVCPFCGSTEFVQLNSN